ncbi:M23 family metallopeptidase [uncultured Sphingomonas sp.]|uniref:M23 family metallopeptidase n=1 Tax=uncultured Sphingomonas sp. TaxID=158754 RepID=UPI0035C9DE1F
MKRLGLAVGGIVVVAGAALVSVTTVRFERAAEPEPLGFTAARPGPLTVEPERAAGLSVPVLGFARSEVRDSWGDARSGGRGHRGIDLMATEGTPVVAVVSGRVEKLFESGLGGTTLYLRSADGRWRYYYAHLKAYAGDVREGMQVRRGQVLGYVGDTGDAGEGNHHLHFSTSRMRPGDRWWQGEDVNPYPLLAEREGAR